MTLIKYLQLMTKPQKLSAKAAIAQGADFLVIGRPITEAKDIGAAFDEIYHSIYE